MSRRSSDRKVEHPPRRARLLLWFLMPLAFLAHALQDDRDQPIHIAADKALRDEKQGITVYSGNVRMSQGSMELEADKLTIYQVSDDADKIVAEGNPAKMRQQPKPDESLVHAHARVITYMRTQDMVHLQDNARIEQAGDLVTGDSIDYFIDKQLIKAEAGKSAKSEQVVVVIQPSTQKKATASPSGGPAPALAEAEGSSPAPDPVSTSAPETPQEATTSNAEQREESASGATEGN